MEADKHLERDWSSLPPEVLNLIAKKLKEISDFVRFRAVCPSWRFSTPVTDLPPQFPWIVDVYRIYSMPQLSFYSMSSDKFYTFHAPKSLDRRVYELTEGYLLITLSGNSLHTQSFLLNPLNNDKIFLPAYDKCCYGYGHRQNQIGEYGLGFKLTLPNPKCRFVLCRLGQDHWSEPITEYNYYNCTNFYLKGMLFTLERTGVTKVTDITTGNLSYVVPPVENYSTVEHSHFLEAFGNILGVFGRHSKNADLLYEVHHLDVNKSGSPCWIKVKNIGNHALFIDRESGFMLKADELAGIKANCIYYFKKIFVGSCGRQLYEMVRIDMETGAKEHRRCPITFREGVGWFVPSLCHLRV